MPRSLSDDLRVRLMEWRKRAARSAANGAELVYLPPYSPGLNPIEQIFARLKVLLRKSAARPSASCRQLSAHCLRASSPTSAPTTFATPHMTPIERNSL